MNVKSIVIIVISVSLIFCIIKFYSLSNKKIEWGARASEAYLTNYKNDTNITFGMYLVNSPVKEDLRTFFLDKDRNKLLVIGHGSTGPWGRTYWR